MTQTAAANALKPGTQAHEQANQQIDWWNAMYAFQQQAALDIPDGRKVEERRATLVSISSYVNGIPKAEQVKYMAIHYTAMGAEAILKIVSACEHLFS